jgi:hypothetical protein
VCECVYVGVYVGVGVGVGAGGQPCVCKCVVLLIQHETRLHIVICNLSVSTIIFDITS